MGPSAFLGYKRAVPFRPFRIVLNSGRQYDVRHRDFLEVGHDSAIFFFRQDPDSPHDRWETFSLDLIDYVEHLETEAAAKR